MLLEIKKIKRSFCVVCGVSVLGKFSTQHAADLSLSNDRDFYEFWSGSAGVSVENTAPTIVQL